MSFHRTCISSHHIAPFCLEFTCKTSSILSKVKDIHPLQHLDLGCNYLKLIESYLRNVDSLDKAALSSWWNQQSGSFV